MKKIPIRELRLLAKKYDLDHVILFAHEGTESGVDHIVTYGKTIGQCSQAADFGNKIKDGLGWPKSLHAQPSRVQSLQDEIETLKAGLTLWAIGTDEPDHTKWDDWWDIKLVLCSDRTQALKMCEEDDGDHDRPIVEVDVTIAGVVK